MPVQSVNHAAPATSASIVASAVGGSVSSRSAAAAMRAMTVGRTPNQVSATYRSAPPAAPTASAALPVTLLSTTANVIHAAASSSAPAASDSDPIVVPPMPRSAMIRASTGNAVIDIAAPM